MELIRFIGRGGFVGLTFGLVFATWVNPNSNEGWAFLVAVCSLLGFIIGIVAPFLWKLVVWLHNKSPRLHFATYYQKFTAKFLGRTKSKETIDVEQPEEFADEKISLKTTPGKDQTD